MTSAHHKGRALEDAVRIIEKAILANSPGLAKDTFKIEGRKIVVVSGVRHEFDVFVTVDHGHGYSSIFVFECKNRQEAVNKNDVLILSGKIEAIHATKGYVIAKSFTEDARAQSLTDPRIALLLAKEHDLASDAIPQSLKSLMVRPLRAEYELCERGTHPEKLIPVLVEDSTVVFRGRTIRLIEHLQYLMRRGTLNDARNMPIDNVEVGDHERTGLFRFHYRPGELMFDGHDIEPLRMRVDYVAEVRNSPVTSHFEVETRGRVVTFAPTLVGGEQVQFRLVLAPADVDA